METLFRQSHTMVLPPINVSKGSWATTFDGIFAEYFPLSVVYLVFNPLKEQRFCEHKVETKLREKK